jgi:hypothetical protein
MKNNISEIEELKQEIQKLKERNKKVETNKAWEISFTRKILLMFLTYFVIVVTLTTIKNPAPWVNAFIPAIAFFLSTLTLPYVKKMWLKYFYKK